MRGKINRVKRVLKRFHLNGSILWFLVLPDGSVRSTIFAWLHSWLCREVGGWRHGTEGRKPGEWWRKRKISSVEITELLLVASSTLESWAAHGAIKIDGDDDDVDHYDDEEDGDDHEDDGVDGDGGGGDDNMIMIVGFAYVWQSKWVEIIAIKTERMQIDFLSEVFAAIASLDLWTLNMSLC